MSSPRARPLESGVLPTTRRGRQLVLGLLGLALALRVGVVIHEHARYVPMTDALAFHTMAQSIAHGHGFGPALQPPAIGPTAFRAPLYPLLLGATYALVGVHPVAGLLVNAVVGTAAVALIGLVAAQLLGRRVGAVALALASVHPGLMLVGSSLQLEPLLITLVLAAIAAALHHRRCGGERLRWAVASGASIGLAALAREQALLFAPAIAWLMWTAKGARPRLSDRRALRAPLLAAMAAVLVLSPWVIRNTATFHELVPVSTSGGFGLAGTYNDTAMAQRARWIPPYDDPQMLHRLVELGRPSETELDSAMRSEVLDVVADHPTYPIKAAFWNTVRGFDLDGGDYTHFISPYVPYAPGLVDPAIFAGWCVLALAVLGAGTRRVRTVPPALWITASAVLGFLVVFLPYSIRYRSLLEPFLLILAASALVTAGERVARGFRAPPPDAGLAEPVPAGAATATAAPASSVHRGRDRSRNLDVLRAVAALMVLVGHSSHLSGEVVPFVSRDAGEVGLNVLISGVWLFFPISGYVIGRSFVRALVAGRPLPSIGGYAARRATRIFPLYWVALAVTVVAVGTQGARLWDLVAHIALLHNLLEGQQQAILPASWTLSLEVVFYAAVPLGAVALARRHRGRPIAPSELAGWIATLWLASIAFTLGADLVGNTTRGLWLRLLFPSMLSMFCPGLLLAAAELAEPGTGLHRALSWVDRHRARTAALAAVALVVAGASTLLDPADGIRRYLVLYDGARIAYAIGFGLLVVLARRGPAWDGAVGRSLMAVGDWSYGVYLLQAVWFYALFEPHPGWVPLPHGGVGAFLVHALVLTALTVPSAAVVHRVLERPAMRLGARIAARWHPMPEPWRIAAGDHEVAPAPATT